MDELIERLADAEHAGWAHWMAYLFSQCREHPDGSVTIPADKVRHWKRQVETPYAGLSEREKESDRAEVRKILPLLGVSAERGDPAPAPDTDLGGAAALAHARALRGRH